MQTPAGFHIVGEGLKARAEITDFWAMVFNPSSMDRLFHTLCGAWQAGAFLVVSVSAWYLLKQRHLEFARASLRVGLVVGLIASLLQLVSGHDSADGRGAEPTRQAGGVRGALRNHDPRAVDAVRLGGREERNHQGRRGHPGHAELADAWRREQAGARACANSRPRIVRR